MNATYTKLRDGNWGLRVEGAPQVGDAVTVVKKSGDTEERVIGRVVWTGERDGKTISLCAIRAKTTCDNCGRHTSRLYDRYDSSGLFGQVCSACNREADYELSFA